MQYTGERIVDGLGNVVEAQIYYFEAAKRISDCHIVLEAACGSGWASHILRSAMPLEGLLLGADVDPQAIVHAKAKFSTFGVAHDVADIRNLPFISDLFDAYVSIETIEHIPETDLAQAIAEAYRVLKFGGKYLVSTPDYDVIPYRPTKPEEIRGYHYRHYKSEELRNSLSAFRKVEIWKPFESSSIMVEATK